MHPERAAVLSKGRSLRWLQAQAMTMCGPAPRDREDPVTHCNRRDVVTERGFNMPQVSMVG
jgi:hypothetical protein